MMTMIGVRNDAIFLGAVILISYLEFWSQVISKEPINKRWLSIHAQHGIPSALRGTIWRILANFTCHEDQYIQLLKQESMDERAILRDLHRTFPHHPFFQSAIGQEALLNIVKAYSILDPEVGYCQGLLFISGPLLLHVNQILVFHYQLTQIVLDARRRSILYTCSIDAAIRFTWPLYTPTRPTKTKIIPMGRALTNTSSSSRSTL